MVDLYVDWCRQYPIISIEDGCAEQDWHGWKLLTEALGDKVQLVGDDVFVTNPEILKKGIAERIGNALLVKVNQIGTITETLDAMAIAAERRLSLRVVASLGRNRGFDDRRPRGRHRRRADQDRLGVAQRSRREIQPAAANRRGAWQRGEVRRPSAIKQLTRNTEHDRNFMIVLLCSVIRVTIFICTNSSCFVTANRPGTRRTGLPGGPTSTSPTRAATKRAQAGRLLKDGRLRVRSSSSRRC